MKCSYCGTEFEGDSCSYCGAQAAASQPQPEPEPSTPQGQPIPPDVQPPVQTPQAQPPAGQQQKPAGCVRFLAVLIMLAVVIMVISMVVNLFGILFDRFSGGRAEVSSEAGRRPIVTESQPENSESDRPPIIVESTPAESEAEPVRITLEKYEQLKNGMSYAQALEILGCEPSSTAEAGEKGTASHLLSCTWVNNGGGVVSLMFRQDKLYTKSQAGLT